MPGYLTANGDYYEGDRQAEDQEVPIRPSPFCDWDGEAWIESPMGYRARRAEAYPPIGDQLDAIWKGGAEAEAMLLQILAVKAAFPKPTA